MQSVSLGWTIFAVFLLSEGFAIGALSVGDATCFYAASMLTGVSAIATQLNIWASA